MTQHESGAWEEHEPLLNLCSAGRCCPYAAVPSECVRVAHHGSGVLKGQQLRLRCAVQLQAQRGRLCIQRLVDRQGSLLAWSGCCVRSSWRAMQERSSLAQPGSLHNIDPITV